MRCGRWALAARLAARELRGGRAFTHHALEPRVRFRVEEQRRTPAHTVDRSAGIMVVDTLIFVWLVMRGCVVFDRVTFRQVATIDPGFDLRLVNVAFNAPRGDVMLMFNTRSAPFAIVVWTMPLENIQQGRVDEWETPFASETIVYPGFFEVQLGGREAITFTPPGGRYTIWDLETYTPLVAVPCAGVAMFSFANHIAVVAGKVREGRSRIRLLCSARGGLLAEFTMSDCSDAPFKVLDLVNNTLFVQQLGAPLHMFDLEKDTHAVFSPTHAPSHTVCILTQRTFMELHASFSAHFGLETGGVVFRDLPGRFESPEEHRSAVFTQRPTILMHRRLVDGVDDAYIFMDIDTGDVQGTVAVPRSAAPRVLCYCEAQDELFVVSHDGAIRVYST